MQIPCQQNATRNKKVKHSENFALIYLVINSATQKKTVQHSRLAVIKVSGTKSWQRKKNTAFHVVATKCGLCLPRLFSMNSVTKCVVDGICLRATEQCEDANISISKAFPRQ